MINIDPQISSRVPNEGAVTRIELAAHFVTTIRAPEAVNSVIVGDPDLFQAEHSEREPTLVFVKALTVNPAETNLLITTLRGKQISLLLHSGKPASTDAVGVDFVVRYSQAGHFLIEPNAATFPSIAQTASVGEILPPPVQTASDSGVAPVVVSVPAGTSGAKGDSAPEDLSLDRLLARQQRAALPELFGQRVEGENEKGDRLRTGISEVIDHGQQVIVLFSVVNTGKHAILLMPPQVQLGGRSRTGFVFRHYKWSTAEQLPIVDYRLSERRIGLHERADGVAVFERPPYKQSNETLFLQMAESGAVDKPALAPIGFGVSSSREEAIHARR